MFYWLKIVIEIIFSILIEYYIENKNCQSNKIDNNLDDQMVFEKNYQLNKINNNLNDQIIFEEDIKQSTLIKNTNKINNILNDQIIFKENIKQPTLIENINKMADRISVTYDLFENQNKDINYIAKYLNLTQKTIEKYIVKLYNQNYKINLNKVDFNDEIYEKIKNNNEIYEKIKNNDVKLNEIKKLLPRYITYLQIELSLARFNKENKIYNPNLNRGYYKYGTDSKGVIKIKKYLNDNKIPFINEKTFPECKYKNLLRFDFYINHDKGNFLIEFDGQQHFEHTGYFGSKEDFNLSLIRDNIKNKFCISNKILLLRISYNNQDNIENILDNYILNLINNKLIVYSDPELYENQQILINNLITL
jgi:hypothetical protein